MTFTQRMARAFSLISFAWFAVACGGGLELQKINSAEARPNNVWVFFTVMDGDEPVGGLEADDFEIYEDGEKVSAFESQQVILNPEVAAVSYTLLLLDMSGSVTESGRADALVDAAMKFSERVGQSQKVAVYAFDGSKDLTPIVRFTEASANVSSGLERLRSYKPKDPSTNLNGAVVEGLQVLEKGLDRDPKPLKFGTLVVFTDGTDRAARVSEQERDEELAKDTYENYEIFAVGVGAEIEESTLRDIGRDGTEHVEDQEKLTEAFDRVAQRIEAHMKRFYLLSYCTPARKGEHEVRIVAKREEPASSGDLKYTFDAEGFGPPPDCNPERKPQFRLDAPSEEQAAGG